MTAFDERPRAMRYISRYERKYLIGWRVDIGQRMEKHVSKFFSDMKYGDQALKKAQRFRNKMLWSLFQSTGIRRLCKGRQLHEKHGLPGGVFYRRYRCKKVGQGWYWIEQFLATIYTPDGKRINRAFSVKKYGYAKAKRMALECRKQLLAEKQQQQ